MLLPRMRDLRTDADLSQKKLSEYIHVGQRTYSHYETGTRDIPLEILIKVADHYNVSLDYITGRTDVKEINRKKKSSKK